MLKWSISTNSKISEEDVFLNTTAEEQEHFRSAKISGEANEEVDNDNDKFNKGQLSANELNKINEDVEIKDNKSDENITEIVLHCHHKNKTGANGPVNSHASEFQKVGHFPETKCESKFSTWDEFANESKLILECIAVFKLWIEGVTNKRIAEGRLFSRLENGTTIKSFLSKIHSGNIPLQRFRSSFKWSRNKNVGYFLKECKKLRVEEEHLFEPEDWQYVTSRPHNLFHDKNWKTSVKKILWTVYRLGLKLKTHRKHRTFVEGVDFTSFAKLFNSHTFRTPSYTMDFQPAEVVDFEEPMYFQEYRLPKLEQATFKPPVVYATQNNRPALFCKQQQPEEKAADKLSTTPAFVKAVEGRKLNLPVFLNKQRSVDSALRTNEVSTMEKRRHTIDRLDDRKRVTFEEHVIHHCCSVENLAKPFFQQQNHPPPNYEEFIKMMKGNEKEEDAEPISFHSYVQPKDPSSNSFNKFLMKSPRLFRRDENNNNKPPRTILKQKQQEAKSPGTDEGYSTSSFNEGTPLLQSTFIYHSPAETCVASKQELNENSVEEMKREKVLKQPTTITNNNHYQQPLQPLPTTLPTTTTLPLQKDLDILDEFLSEFTSPEKKEELTPVEPIDHKPVEVPGFHVSATYHGKSQTLPNPPVTKLKGIESSQSSGTLKDRRLTSDLQTVVSDLLTLGKNKNTLEEGDHLVDLDNLDEFFENIGIADVTDSDDDPTYDSGIEETMPALLKDGGSKPRKSQKSKHSDSKTEDKKKELRRHKKKNDDEATSRRKRDDRTDSKTKKSHDRPSLERRHNKTEPINMKKARQDEKASDMRRTNSDSFVPRKQRDKQTSIKGKTIPQTSGRTVPDSIPLKRNNSVHIKGEEYILDDGKQQVYLRSKADEAPPLPNKIDLLNDYDRNIRTLLRTDDPHIINQLGVSPDIIKLLKEEESFWQKQQELKKWRESRDRQVSNANIHIPPVRPKRHPASSKSEIYPSSKEQRNTTDNSSRKTSDHSRHDRTEHSRHNATDNSRDLRRRDRDRADHKPRGNREQNRDRYHPMSESEREMEEEKLAREAERLMRLRAEQIHVLNVSRENLLREEKNIQRQLSTDTPRSGTWDNLPSSSRSSAKAYLSPDSEPIYDRSKQSVMKNMRQMKTTHERNESCFSDDEVFNQKSPTRRVDNRGYFSDHDVFRESSTFQARPVHKSHRRTKLRCTACNRPINDERLITVEEKGYNWHGRCFVCVVCRVFLNDKHVVRVRVVDNRLHCRFCYSASNGDELMSEV